MSPAEDATSPVTARPARVRGTLARGFLVLVGILSLAQGMALLRGTVGASVLGLVDLTFLPRAVAIGVDGCVAVLSLAWALWPRAAERRRTATAVALLALAAGACVGAARFYLAWRAGTIAPALPLPLEGLVALLLAAAAHVMWRERSVPNVGGLLLAIVVFLTLAAYPVARSVLAGSVDHRAPADAAVVLGAKVDPSGALSQSLEDRVRTAADLYRAGLVHTLVMSGATGAEGYDEPASMRSRAEQLGVPSSAIVLDRRGVDTAATAADTVPLLRLAHDTRVLAVSQFYHLPRVQFAFALDGLDVLTVPATTSRYIVATPIYVGREIPGYWVYWAEAVWRVASR